MSNKPIIIIGAGPSGLMAAQELAEGGKKVHIYDHHKAPARKFLVAGHGGFNLTHSEPVNDFVQKYDKEIIGNIVCHFDNKAVVNWLQSLGIETYVGSSGKVFPVKDVKPIQVLNAWMERLKSLGVEFYHEYKLVDFDDSHVVLDCKSQQQSFSYDKLILALGGGSWSKTGSTGEWMSIFETKGIQIIPFQAANSGYHTLADYTKLEGKVLKNIVLDFKGHKKKGEILFTHYGIEGSAVYYFNRYTRSYSFPVQFEVDLKPTWTEEQLKAVLNNGKKTTDILKNKIKIGSVGIDLLRELDKDIYMSDNYLAKYIKRYPIVVNSLRPIDEVISTCGGLSMEEVNQHLALNKYSSVFCIGEMLDWDAPTGGYLLQACFSMGYFCAHQILDNA